MDDYLWGAPKKWNFIRFRRAPKASARQAQWEASEAKYSIAKILKLRVEPCKLNNAKNRIMLNVEVTWPSLRRKQYVS